jgi:2-methylaconitate cis-trans-isomerase PrpF
VSVLALGLLGGATGMARCPQLVSFSAATLPLVQEAQTLPTGDFHNAVFRPAGAAHETLLKASMPSLNTELKTAGQPTRQKSHHSTRPSLRRVKKIRSQGQQQWLVLTSWNEVRDESGGARLVLTVAREQNFYASYAAVPTAGGWLVFQL